MNREEVGSLKGISYKSWDYKVVQVQEPGWYKYVALVHVIAIFHPFAVFVSELDRQAR